MSTSEEFLIDANVFITAAKHFYAYDLVPTFWEAFDKKIKDKHIVLLDMVKIEIDKRDDELHNWVTERVGDFQESSFYNDQALASWAEGDAADPWLVAAAMAKDYTLITFERSAGPLNAKMQSGKVKIPDVANRFGVKIDSLFNMMRRLDIKI